MVAMETVLGMADGAYGEDDVKVGVVVQEMLQLSLYVGVSGVAHGNHFALEHPFWAFVAIADYGMRILCLVVVGSSVRDEKALGFP